MEVETQQGPFLLLSEEQNAAFDREYHSEAELAAKFEKMEGLFGDRPFEFLDLGGGNGKFADQVLDRFPQSSGVIIDVSELLLSRNKKSPRKELVCGSIEDMTTILGGRRFDCITINWVLHHLIGNSYGVCRENCIKTLQACQKLLKPGGVLIVTENMFNGYLGTDIPSHVIYAITSVRQAWFVGLARRFFNTAGVGVCFHSQGGWQDIFKESDCRLLEFLPGLVWPRSFKRGLAFSLLFLRPVSHGHFFLKTAADLQECQHGSMPPCIL